MSSGCAVTQWANFQYIAFLQGFLALRCYLQAYPMCQRLRLNASKLKDPHGGKEAFFWIGLSSLF